MVSINELLWIGPSRGVMNTGRLLVVSIAVKILAGLILCSVVSASNPVVKSIDVQPLGPVGSALHLSDTKTICLQLSKELSTDWPIFEAISNWNANGLNLFTTGFQVKCDGVVLVTESDTKQWWGSTEFYSRDLINVQLSIATPASRHLAVVCHELGHVLGFPHSKDDGSCMDPTKNNPEPTQENLSTVAKTPWSAKTAQYSMSEIK